MQISVNAEVDRNLGRIQRFPKYMFTLFTIRLSNRVHEGPVEITNSMRKENGISHVSILDRPIPPEHPVIHRKKQRVSTMSIALKDSKVFNEYKDARLATKSQMDLRF